jgi:dTMP kinase
VREINDFATGGLTPDRTLLLSIDPAIGRARSLERAEGLDRLEREEDEFRTKIALAYERLAAEDPARIRTIDAGQEPQAVLSSALVALGDLL